MAEDRPPPGATLATSADDDDDRRPGSARAAAAAQPPPACTKSQVCSTDHPRRANLLRIPNPPSAFHLNTHPPSTIPRHLPPPAPSTTMTMTSAPLPSYLLYLVNLTTDPACFINPLSTEQRLPGLSNPPQRSLSNNNSSTYPDVRHPPPPGASNSPISNTTAEDKRYESKLDV